MAENSRRNFEVSGANNETTSIVSPSQLSLSSLLAAPAVYAAPASYLVSSSRDVQQDQNDIGQTESP